MSSVVEPGPARQCPDPDCLAPNSVPGRKHNWNYHLMPVSFSLGGSEMCFTFEEGKLLCPFPDCLVVTNRRDRAMKHVRKVHDLPQHVLVFNGPAGEPGKIKVDLSHTLTLSPVLSTHIVSGEQEGSELSPSGPVLPASEKETTDAPPLQAQEQLLQEQGERTGEKFLVENETLTFCFCFFLLSANANPSPMDPKGTVVLSPLIDYLEGGEVLDKLGIWFHLGLNVFICRSCQVCLTFDVLKGHLKAQHKHVVPRQDLEDLQVFLHDRHVYDRPEEVPLPSPGGPPVQGLCAPQHGFTCQMRGCAYASKSEEVMKRHDVAAHGLVYPQERRYRDCKVQALFNSVGRVFFQIQDELPNETKDESLLRAALLDVGATWSADGTAAIATDKDRTPPALLRVTGWGEHLPSVRASRALRAKTLALKDKLKADELGGILQGLPVAVDGLFQLGRTLLNGHSSKLTALKVVIHGASIPSEGATHWTPLTESNENYPRFLTEMLTAILRSRLAADMMTTTMDTGFCFFLSTEQKSSLQALVEALRREEMEEVIQSCQGFLWTVVSAKDQGNWTDVVQQWIWLKALRPDGNFYPASSLTPDLAKLKYVIRQTVLIQAFTKPLHDNEELIK
ncbi:hypothetical protein JVT61DRAFT_13396 [Boletus reticuloceps]|uniref:C2H2-type domain-containing protein n=1 Tax=Boletus reticuloceps TaxID=495285 RepID=A0A8I2YDK1_9AGAM|nr:hypothetical protein JVT61DRAFT_13396 [Boletus reticuloceps]